MKRVLIACEFSGRVRDAFIRKGYDAISCDLRPSLLPGPHIQGDVLPILRKPWDIIIAHPECTFLCNSGVRWLYSQPGRFAKMGKAIAFFKACLNANAKSICVENPIPHGYALSGIGTAYSQIIQPWQFGHGETKATCLWLKNLPLLKPTNIVRERVHRIHELPPSKNRSMLRSITYFGIAKAMAEQWG